MSGGASAQWERVAVTGAGGVAYVALALEGVAAAAGVLREGLGLQEVELEAGEGEPVPVFAVGETALALFPVGHALLGEGGAKAGVHHLALASADPVAAVTALGLPQAGGPGFEMVEGLAGRRAVAISPEATLGVRVRYHEPFAIGSGGSLEPSLSGVVERIDHLGVASTDSGAAVALFHERLGFPLESRQTDREVHVPVESFTSDKYGVVYHSRAPIDRGALEVAFVTMGDFELEFLQDAEEAGAAGALSAEAAGNTQQDRGAISRFVGRRGAGLHHLALKTTSIEATLQRLREAGVGLIDESGAAGVAPGADRVPAARGVRRGGRASGRAGAALTVRRFRA